MTASNAKSPAHATTRNRASIHIANPRRLYSSPGKRLPPFSSSIAWKRERGAIPLLTIITGHRAMAEAQKRLDDEKRFPGDRRALFCILPFEHPPASYDWSVSCGLYAVIEVAGIPETDLSMKALAFQLLDAGAGPVAWLVSNGELMLLKRDELGATWSL